MDVVRGYLDQGAPVSASDSHGQTPLAAAEAMRAIDSRNGWAEGMRNRDEVTRLLRAR